MNKTLIKQILLEQKEELQGLFRERIIPRDIAPDQRTLLRSNLIKVVIGVRRCGKSTWAHDLLRGNPYGYVNFDDERLIGVQTQDLNDFLEALHEIEGDLKFLLLDEIQNVTGWELFVNRLKRSGYNIIVTGSNSKLLSRELATHLTGRHLSIELYPFSFSEFLLYHGEPLKDILTTRARARVKKRLETYLEYGGLPEAIKIEPKLRYLQELYDRIITRDIILRYKVKYVRDLKEIALFAISNFASKISYHKIRNIFEMKSVHTIKNYIGYLEEAYLLFQLNAFSFKLKEQLKLPKKIYCIDTGMIHAIASKNTLDRGKVLENAVFIELKRRGGELYFYSQPNYEVDFLVRERSRIKELIQVSYNLGEELTRKREIASLLKASKELACRHLTLITWDEEEDARIGSQVIKIVPLWKWLLTPSRLSARAHRYSASTHQALAEDSRFEAQAHLSASRRESRSQNRKV